MRSENEDKAEQRLASTSAAVDWMCLQGATIQSVCVRSNGRGEIGVITSADLDAGTLVASVPLSSECTVSAAKLLNGPLGAQLVAQSTVHEIKTLKLGELVLTVYLLASRALPLAQHSVQNGSGNNWLIGIHKQAK